MLRILGSAGLGVSLAFASSACAQGSTPEVSVRSALPELAGADVRSTPSGIISYIDRKGPAGGTASRRVLLISVDGLAPYVRARARTPTLDRLAREGVSFSNATTVVPSITLTSHASMLTGVAPEQHHMLWNVYDPSQKFRTPTVFTQCGQHQLRCAIFAGKEKFVHFAELEPGVQHYEYRVGADAVMTAATRYILSEKPDFVFIHVAEVDGAGHSSGWNSPAQLAAIEAIDTRLGQLASELSGGDKPLTLIVSADHGGHDHHHSEDIADNRQIPWIGYGDGIQKLGLTESPRPVSTVDTAATVLALLGLPAPPALAGRVIALSSVPPRPATPEKAQR